jgi:hypothetical protein
MGVHHLGLVQPVDRLSQGIVIGIPGTSYRGGDTGINQALGILDR